MQLLESQLFKAKYLADKDSIFCTSRCRRYIDPSLKGALWVCELRQRAWQSDGTGEGVDSYWHLIVHALILALFVEYVAKRIKAALLCAKRSRRRFRHVLLQSAMHPVAGDRLVAAGLLECAHARSRASSSLALRLRAPQDGYWPEGPRMVGTPWGARSVRGAEVHYRDLFFLIAR